MSPCSALGWQQNCPNVGLYVMILADYNGLTVGSAQRALPGGGQG